MIPTDRPVRGADIQTIERQLGLHASDVQYVLGCTPQAYYQLRTQMTSPTAENAAKASKGGGSSVRLKPVMSQAILLRLLSENPDWLPIPKAPTILDLYDLCKEIDPEFSPRHLGVLLGRDGTAGYKWMSRPGGSPMRQEVERLALVVYLALKDTPASKRKVRLAEIFDKIILEASLRGLDTDLLRERFQFKAKSAKTAVKPKSRKSRKTAPIATPK